MINTVTCSRPRKTPTHIHTPYGHIISGVFVIVVSPRTGEVSHGSFIPALVRTLAKCCYAYLEPRKIAVASRFNYTNDITFYFAALCI